MSTAFSTFDEPHAWLIRGLVEYGWVDVSRPGAPVPPGAVGGFDLQSLGDGEGRDGIVLVVPARSSAGGTCIEDDPYRFQVKVTGGGRGVTVRCPEANYFQEFPYDPANPLWAAGYVHQSVAQYVPQFVDWRLAGGEVPWSQRAGIPDVEGEPCSFALARFVADRLRAGRPFHEGPDEGWWQGGSRAATGATGAAANQPVTPAAVLGAAAGGEQPPAPAPVPVARAGKAGVADVSPAAEAARRVAGPGAALATLSVLGGLQGLLWFVNAATIVLFYRKPENLLALVASLFLGVVLVAGALVGFLGARRYRELRGGVLPWLSMGYVALAPGCCLAGLPVAVWAALTWRRPAVRAARGE